MNLKHTLLVAGLTVACAAVAPAALAVQGGSPDGTITINGLVVANSCVVNANGTGTNNATVTLPTVYTSALSAAGNVAGKTGFSISVTGCDPNLSNVSTYWSGANVQTDGNLKNTAGTNNVEVQLLNAGGTAMTLNSAQGSQGSQVVNLSGGAATLNYSAQYYATAAATPGRVGSTVSFTLIYQ